MDQLQRLAAILDHPESLGIDLVHKSKSSHQQKELEASLQATCESLFRSIDQVHQQHGHLLRKSRGGAGSDKGQSLSPLESLVIPATDSLDAETLWAQVDLQNLPLQKRIQTSVKRLQAASENAIRLLVIDEDEESEADEDELVDGSEFDEAGSDAGSETDDAETQRMRDRMERAMTEMDSEHESDDESNNPVEEGANSVSSAESTSREEALVDPAAEKLNDGFFDLNEMEAFADEEEEYLPDEAYGQEADTQDDKAKDTRSFHQRQREGDFVSDDDDDDGEDEADDDDLLFRKPTSVRRRKYREDDEIKALFNLYEEPNNDLDDDQVINMTAADLFGRPDKKYQHSKKRNSGEGLTRTDDDDDSWDDHQFDNEKMDAAWGFDGERDPDTEGDEMSSDAELDEMLPMKGSKGKANARGSGQPSKLVQQTEELEAEMLAEKPWQMVGETGSMERPVNSLLDMTPEFEVASKLKPLVTVEQTADLEELIKQRILKEDWDDVVPRELPDVGWHSKRKELPEVSQEKSKLSLGELYEQEYLKKAVGYDTQAAEKQSADDKAKDEMKSLFANLCSKLDALSNYHFTPRPIAEEAEVRAITTPAIAAEEVLPLYVSDARGAAPEEVYGAKRGRESVLRGESEMEQDERKRLRGSKKSARRKARKEKLADEKLITRLQPGLGLNNPYEKRKIREELSAARSKGRVTDGEVDTNDYGASGTFFARLQGEAGQKIRGVVDAVNKKPRGRSAASSNALKL